MTPRFTGINVPGVEFSQTEPQKHAFFSDFGSDLRQNLAFSGSKYFLKVVLKLKVLQFTFTELVVPVGALQDTGKVLLRAPEKICKKIVGQNPFGSWNIHIFSSPPEKSSSIAFICAEKMNFK
jgi:hypothetical protein